ncbi:peptide ABC transporter substrate-binding protein (plasmid) [Pseudonocardia sp. EC080610-09]|nr:peptide ABC transporter substrate-binding protein [Pseudonocardia sp. EC080610-09]ALL85793.1 peptide ABC transporter substrate-binding protein [Pseudonocardia sp. EC080619-01]
MTAATALAGTSCATGRAATPDRAGGLTFLIDSLGDTWIPNNSAISSFQGHVWGHVTDKLVHVDDTGAVSPWIARSWEQDERATEFVLHLRRGVTFSDGTPLDAAAVVANLDIWARGDSDRGIKPIGLFPKSYRSAQALDPTTVRVRFDTPTLGFVPTLGYHGSILISPRSLDLPAEQQADLYNDIGSGPYVVESWRDDDHVVLRRRADYAWGPDALGHTGPARIETITYEVVAEQRLRSASVQAGQADVAYNPSPKELESVTALGFVAAAPRYLGFVAGMAINTDVAPFDDVRVRRALQHGIDRDEILATIYTPDWLPAESMFQSNTPGATDHRSSFRFDPALAAQLLDEAGFVPGPDGVRTRGTDRLALTLHPNPYLATSEAVDELVSQQLRRLGFEVTVRTYDVVTYTQRVDFGEDTVPAYELTRSIIDAGTVASVLTDQDKGEDWFNLGTSDARMVSLASGIAGASDPAARERLLDELQRHVLDQGYFVPLNQQVQRIYLQSPRVRGVTYNGVAYANYATAWLEDDPR